MNTSLRISHILVVFLLGINSRGVAAEVAANESQKLRDQQIARLQEFSRQKEKQSLAFAAKANEPLIPEFRPFFDAATKGDWRTVIKMWKDFHKRHPQYSNSTGDTNLWKSYWSPILEISMAYEDVINCEPKYIQMAVDDMLGAVPRGSIYFGGTDPGRALPTAFCRSHVEADPFFTLTQNALADGTYLKYLRDTYGGKIYTPSDDDSQRCFAEYVADAENRLKKNELKPGENVRMVAGKPQVSGQVAVMAINALLTKIIFDKNPDREFYLEESFPLDWMYPHLEPRGLIMKINRQPLAKLSDAVNQADRKYWRDRVGGMLGDWLAEDTLVAQVAEFVTKVYVRQDLDDFKGDTRFIASRDAQLMFSKWRSSIGGIYAWRAEQAADLAEKSRMKREADFAFRQAFALCPSSPEAIFRYVNLLVAEKRNADALLVAETALKADPKNRQVRNLVNQIKSGELGKER